MNLSELQSSGKAPYWLTEEAYLTLCSGYLQKGETPYDAYMRVAYNVSLILNRPELCGVFFNLIWSNWLCPSTPVLSNVGTKNLPIACYGGEAPDDTYGIMDHITENVMLTKFGGGVGSFWGNLRSKGTPISRGGMTDGIIGFVKMLESCVDGTRQGGTRRGSAAAYLPAEHGDASDFVDIRKPTGDLSKRCLTKTFHNALTFKDETMNAIINGDKYYRELWNKTMTNRVELGEPYVMFTDNANKNTFSKYIGRNRYSNLCSEIFLPTSFSETFVCCLSSLNLAKYREWEKFLCPITGYSAVELSIMFLDGVMEIFIKQIETGDFPGLERAYNFAKNHRALGLGVLGWHTLLQQEGIPFASYSAMTLNNSIFSKMRGDSDKMTLVLGKIYGECRETAGTGRRNAVTLAIAPTMSNSVLSGGVSQGIEPITANLFVQKSAKGSFIKKNKVLEALLEDLGLNNTDTWELINKDMGSVRNIKKLSDEQKAIFLTAREIDQYSIVQQAAQRQKYIDQGQSINLFFSISSNKNEANAIAKYINEVHLSAWELGVKSLYYLKTSSPIKGQKLTVDKEESCLSCEG